MKNILAFIVILIFPLIVFTQNDNQKEGTIFIPSDKYEARVSFTNAGTRNIGYSIFNNPVPHDFKKETIFSLRVNGKEIRYKNKPVFVYPGGRPFIEGDNIEVIRRSYGVNNDAYLSFSTLSNIDLFNTKITGTFSITNSNGPSLLIKLKKSRTFRIHLDQFSPKIDKNTSYELQVIVDGEEIRNGRITNKSSMDVHGSEILIIIKSWPPTRNGFRISGIFETLK